MSTIDGTWALRMRTPIGSIQAEVTFQDSGYGIEGVAVGAAESVPLRDVRITDDGGHLTWSQTISKPMRLHLDFDVHVRDDEMQGHSRAGRLPRSVVTGTRLR